MCEPRSRQNYNLAADLGDSMEYTHWLGVREEFSVHFVHGCEIVHVGKEDVDLDCLGKA